MHAGDNVATYSDNNGMDTHMYHHAGQANILAYAPRIAGTWPSPDKLVVSGSSAGGQTGLITGGAINSAPGPANLFLGVVTKSGSFFGFLEALRNEREAADGLQQRVHTRVAEAEC